MKRMKGGCGSDLLDFEDEQKKTTLTYLSNKYDVYSLSSVAYQMPASIHLFYFRFFFVSRVNYFIGIIFFCFLSVCMSF